MLRRILASLPRGYTLPEADWRRRHRMLLWVLAAHLPALAVTGLSLGTAPTTVALSLLVIPVCVGAGWALRAHRRTSAVIVTAGLAWCSAVLVAFTHGTIEAHFHFFIIIGFIALYQDWAPLLFNILFTVVSHGIGSAWQRHLIFGNSAGAENPWLWSIIHGMAVLFACAGMLLFWRFTEDTQHEKDALSQQVVESEMGRRRFTSDLLTNLARRNQALLYRQLDIINQLEESERDPDALAELFAIDHLATRVRRNAENLLVLSGEKSPRTWTEPVPLRDVLRAAIAETEDLERVTFAVDERLAVLGHTVTDLTHLIAELTENAVRFSPPDTMVTVRARALRDDSGGTLLTIEDWGVGMPPQDMADANAILAAPPEIDLSVALRLGFHVVGRLAARHAVGVTLTATPGSGVTAAVRLPGSLFADTGGARGPAEGRPVMAAASPEPAAPARPAPVPSTPLQSTPPVAQWPGWWEPGADDVEPVIVVRPYMDASTHPGARPAPSPRPREPVALPAQRTATVPSDPPQPGPQAGLRRRVPQANLHPELRRTAETLDHVPAAPTTPDAAAALSRYQASRAAAQETVHQYGRPEGAP